MGISSAYLRVHWVSDILASYCLGYIMFSLAITLLKSSKKS
jgi:undecaprenyl-diphosphatase